MDPNAAQPPLGAGIEELFEDLDDVDVDVDAHARASAEEKKEEVFLDDSTLVGLLPKKLNDKQLDAPTTVVELTHNKINFGVDMGLLSDAWKKLSVMRVGYANTVIGLTTMRMPKVLTRNENNFIAGEDGFIIVYLTMDSAACKNAVVHDIGESPIKFIHAMWRLGSMNAVRYDVGLRRFDPVLYKEKAVTAFVDDEDDMIAAWAAYKQTDGGKEDKNGAIVVARKSGARGLTDARLRIKIGNCAKKMPERINLEERIPIFISGPDEDDLVSAYSACVGALTKHVGAAGAEDPKALRSCFRQGFKVVMKIAMEEAGELKRTIAGYVAKTKEGTCFHLKEGDDTFDVKYWPDDRAMATALGVTAGRGGAGGAGNEKILELFHGTRRVTCCSPLLGRTVRCPRC